MEQWKLSKPNGPRCRMLQCAAPAQHTGTEVTVYFCLTLIWSVLTAREYGAYQTVFVEFFLLFYSSVLANFDICCLFRFNHVVQSDGKIGWTARERQVTKVRQSKPLSEKEAASTVNQKLAHRSLFL